MLSELYVHVATGNTNTRRVALAALVEACLAASGTVRALGHTAVTLAVMAVRAYLPAGDPRGRDGQVSPPRTRAEQFS